MSVYTLEDLKRHKIKKCSILWYMNKHRSEDYKIALVEYQNKYDLSFNEMSRRFGCSVRSLIRWSKRYSLNGNIERNNRESISYKMKQKHIEYAFRLLSKNKHYSLEELVKRIKNKYNYFDITPSTLRKSFER